MVTTPTMYASGLPVHDIVVCMATSVGLRDVACVVLASQCSAEQQPSVDTGDRLPHGDQRAEGAPRGGLFRTVVANWWVLV